MPTDPQSLSRVPRLPPPLVVALGSFDGVHLGHQQIIRRAAEIAAGIRGLTGVLTYDPLPAQLIYPDFTYILTTLAEKKSLLTELGVECICLLRFDAELRGTAAPEFIRHHIVESLHPAAVVVGHDHRFGSRGTGDAGLLSRTLEPLGIRVDVIPEILLRSVPVRSTTIREHLLLGHVSLAAELLGRCYAMSGTIVPGTGTGRRLGFPTINLRPFERETLVPADGVYLCQVDAAARRFDALLNIGHRPTFGGETRTIEAHLLDVELAESPRSAVFRLVDRLRPERRFENPAALASQIAEDVATARKMLVRLAVNRNLDSQTASNNL
jgi:riboflavin kinase / FMN adenylyltransferase